MLYPGHIAILESSSKYLFTKVGIEPSSLIGNAVESDTWTPRTLLTSPSFKNGADKRHMYLITEKKKAKYFLERACKNLYTPILGREHPGTPP